MPAQLKLYILLLTPIMYLKETRYEEKRVLPFLLSLIPFLKDMEQNLGFRYTGIVADAGYESEENYLFIETNGQTAFIKPNNYEISKKRKFKTDIGRMENMSYDTENDFYICKNNQKLTVQYEKQQQDTHGRRPSINVPAALIKRIVLKAIIAKHQWNNAIKHCMFPKQ